MDKGNFDLKVPEKHKKLLTEANKQEVEIIEATTFRRAWGSKSSPISVKCANGKYYVVKGKKSAGRQMINDQIVARLGQKIEAPVGCPAIVNISQDLINIEPDHFEDFNAGTTHGTEVIKDCFDSYDLLAIDHNRSRLAVLALLFGWTHASDHQFIYTINKPPKIYSVDHGHFFPNPPNWTVEYLKKDTPAQLDSYFDKCNFSPEDFKNIYELLNNITTKMIVRAVSFPRKEWGITFEEKLEMINYLVKRQEDLKSSIKSRLEES